MIDPTTDDPRSLQLNYDNSLPADIDPTNDNAMWLQPSNIVSTAGGSQGSTVSPAGLGIAPLLLLMALGRRRSS